MDSWTELRRHRVDYFIRTHEGISRYVVRWKGRDAFEYAESFHPEPIDAMIRWLSDGGRIGTALFLGSAVASDRPALPESIEAGTDFVSRILGSSGASRV